jgi:hypothetical protein
VSADAGVAQAADAIRVVAAAGRPTPAALEQALEGSALAFSQPGQQRRERDLARGEQAVRLALPRGGEVQADRAAVGRVGLAGARAPASRLGIRCACR